MVDTLELVLEDVRSFASLGTQTMSTIRTVLQCYKHIKMLPTYAVKMNQYPINLCLMWPVKLISATHASYIVRDIKVIKQ